MNTDTLSGGGPTQLHSATTDIISAHPVRKSRAQKAAFRADATATLQQAGWPVQTETSGKLVQSNNLIAGDITTAKLVFTAHYDTPARLPFPNFIAPRNLAANILYQLLLVVLISAPVVGAEVLMMRLGLSPFLALLFCLALCGLLIYLVMAGPANPHNANDNTSGVATLLEIATALPAGLQSQVALVFFDNEELGLVGSSAFRAKHGKLADKLLINYDCVGDGDTLLFLLTKGSRKHPSVHNNLLAAHSLPAAKRDFLIDSSPLSFYPSDQAGFGRGVAVCATRHAFFGYYITRIHTSKDTVLQPENIVFLREGAVRLAGLLPQEASHAQ